MVRGRGLKALTSQFPRFHFYLFPSPTFICTDVWRYPASYCVDRGTFVELWLLCSCRLKGADKGNLLLHHVTDVSTVRTQGSLSNLLSSCPNPRICLVVPLEQKLLHTMNCSRSPWSHTVTRSQVVSGKITGGRVCISMRLRTSGGLDFWGAVGWGVKREKIVWVLSLVTLSYTHGIWTVDKDPLLVLAEKEASNEVSLHIGQNGHHQKIYKQ